MAHLAKKIGVNSKTIYFIVYGIQCPSLIIAARIVDYCRGDVSYDDILEPFLLKGKEFLDTGEVLTGISPKGPTGNNKIVVKNKGYEDD